MLIRPDQIQALTRYSADRYMDRVFEHASKCFPEAVAEIGETGAREMIRMGVERAEGYGFVTEYDAVRYVDLIFVFGMDFDQDPALQALAEILTDDPYGTATDKMDDLVEVALEYAQRQKE